jgi:hypothetical protein
MIESACRLVCHSLKANSAGTCNDSRHREEREVDKTENDWNTQNCFSIGWACEIYFAFVSDQNYTFGVEQKIMGPLPSTLSPLSLMVIFMSING